MSDELVPLDVPSLDIYDRCPLCGEVTKVEACDVALAGAGSHGLVFDSGRSREMYICGRCRNDAITRKKMITDDNIVVVDNKAPKEFRL